jgi:hypothetical protein
MTKDEALKLALEALEEYVNVVVSVNDPHEWTPKVADAGEPARKAITAIKEALEQPEQDGKCKYCTDGCPACDARKLPEQERFLVATIGNWGRVEWADGVFPSLGDKMYSAPRTWVGLTDEEVANFAGELWPLAEKPVSDRLRAIEAKLKERNT